MHFTVARDGWLFITPAIVMTGLFAVLARYLWTPLWAFALAGVLAAICFAFFFRDPHRRVPAETGIVVAPADGRIVIVDSLSDGRTQIDIFLSVLNVHVNRSPATGTVTSSEHRSGQFHAAMKPEAGHSNERQEIALSTAHGEIRFAQIAGVLARRIVCRLKPGDQIRIGERFGLIRFGSRMQVITPAGFRATVAIGETVRAGETVLARLSD